MRLDRTLTNGLLFTLVIALSSISVHAQGAAQQVDAYGQWFNGLSEPWWFRETAGSAAEVTTLKARWEAIAKETGTEAHPWAGDYFLGGETHGDYLRWSPRGGFVWLNVNKCEASVHSFSYGQVIVTPTRIQLVVEKQHGPSTHGHESQASPPSFFVPVSWRETKYLIPEEELSDFCEFAAGLSVYADRAISSFSFQFFYRLGDAEAASVAAVPVVPPGYERFVREPVNARIIKVLKREVKRSYTYRSSSARASTTLPYGRASLTYVLVNAGSNKGVRRDGVFTTAGLAEAETVHVLRVTGTNSVGVIIRPLDRRGGESYIADETGRTRRPPAVAAGWKITTAWF